MFLTSRELDLGLVYMIRNLTKNFIINNLDVSINELPLQVAPVVEREMTLK